MKNFTTEAHDIDIGEQPRALEGIHARIIRFNNHARSIDDAMENIGDRIFGALPKAPVDSGETKVGPSGSVEKIHAALNVMENILDRMQSNINRLDGV